jgi:aminomethyltransferase
MSKRTALYKWHVAAAAKMVDFAGWEMPLHYGSQIDEHHCVRRAVGMFDVSHMTVLDISGVRARAFLRYVLANDVALLDEPGRALYSCLLNDAGGILDDLIVYSLAKGRFRLVSNAATRGKVVAWLTHHAEPFGLGIAERTDLALIAVQGPSAPERVLGVLDAELRARVCDLASFQAAWNGDNLVARTGYTGEDGFEIMIPAERALELVQALTAREVSPAGLAARDTLRLEAGLNLYGADMDESVTPLDSGLGWTVAWQPEDRDFVGREALKAQRAEGVRSKRVGLLLEGAGVMRAHQRVLTADGGEGVVTSGGFSPTLKRSIALARVPVNTCQERALVEIRQRPQPVRLVRPPFVRHGKPCFGAVA